IHPDLILARWPADRGRGDDRMRRLVEAASSGRWIPVIFHSPRAGEEDRIAALELGALDLLAPIPGEPELLARLRAALRIRRRMDDLERRAYRDALTGLLNRGALDDLLRRQWDGSIRHGAGLAILIADLDHLKAINDAHGHEAGDEALRRAAAVLARSVRSSDLVARRGGDEFIIVAPGCPTAAALAIAVRIRNSLDGPSGPIPVTLSLGIATIGNAAIGDLADLLHRADGALRLAKRSGRNAIAIDDPDQRGPSLVPLGRGN
ncbi:MAG: GGDEF domain-containing protein, partial [Isosphaeraceae bacterium]